MAKKFVLGKIGAQIAQTGNIGGVQKLMFGVRGVKPALQNVDNGERLLENGEIVEIYGNTEKGYLVREVTSSVTATTKLGIIMQDVAGDTKLDGGYVTTKRTNVVHSIWVLDEPNLGAISAYYLDTVTDAQIGGDVFLGLGTNGTVGGSLYGVAGTGRLALSYLEFNSKAYKPTKGQLQLIDIRRKA